MQPEELTLEDTLVLQELFTDEGGRRQFSKIFKQVAKKMKVAVDEGHVEGLEEDEIAFYDALLTNGSAKEVMQDSQLRELARLLVEKVRNNTGVDWTIRANVQARLRVEVKKLLNKYGYPPDQQAIAADNILKQAELFAEDWSR